MGDVSFLPRTNQADFFEFVHHEKRGKQPKKDICGSRSSHPMQSFREVAVFEIVATELEVTPPASTIAPREGTRKFCFARFGRPALQPRHGT